MCCLNLLNVGNHSFITYNLTDASRYTRSVFVYTSLSGLAAHSRDSRGDLDMMVALVCMIGLNDHT